MVIVLDIETSNAKEGVIDPDKDRLIVIGLQYENGVREYFYQKDWFRAKFKLMRSKEPVVGHNLLGFDIPVLKRYGFDFSDRVIIDTYDILKLKRRAQAMMYADLAANGGHGLANVCKFFKLPVRKIEDFDYSVLNKQMLLPRDVEYINEYLGRDLEAARAVYDYLVSVVGGIKPFMSEKDQDEYKWLTTSPGVCAYKVICNQAGLVEEYGDGDHVDYPGAYVHYPNVEEAHDNVYSFDYKSLYPHCMMMLNVFGVTTEKGDKIESIGDFKPKGSYSKSNFGKVSQVLQRMFELKDQYEKDGDKAGRLATKIVLNTVYGILGNPAFKSVANPTAAEDVTQLGQYFTKTAIRLFEEQGYKVLYGDTDSVYLQDPYSDEDRLHRLAEAITRKLSRQTPFPQDTFSLAMEERIRDVYFFQEDDVFKKKFYIYVTVDGDMTVKGLPIKKRDRCELSKVVFSRLKPKMIEQRTARFRRELIDSLIKHNFKSPEMAGKVLFSKPIDEYKSHSSLQAQATLKWGAGRHVIVPVVKGEYDGLEIGKGSMYLRIQDFINLKLPFESVRLEHIYKDLSYFIKEESI